MITPQDLDNAYCTLHNLGANLRGNTQASDMEWLAQCLFSSSRLGAGDIKTVDWLIGYEQWQALGLTPQAMLGDGPRHWEALSEDERDAWRKLARICMYLLPALSERIGSRMMAQAKAIRAVWKQEMEGDR